MSIRTEFVSGYGGVRLAVHRMGEGRPVLLLHGLISSAQVNWIKFGTAQRLVDAGFEAIMPDLRAHGQSEAPRDPAAYPDDVLVKDALTLVDALGLADFDLGGFSLGARTAVGAVLAGAAPSRLVLGGMGLEGLTQWSRRSAHFIGAIERFGTIERGDPAFVVQAFMKTMKADPLAMRLLLGSVHDIQLEALASVAIPTIVICGAQDHDNGSGPRLADALPDGRYVEVPGNHMNSVTTPQFAEAIAGFLAR
jgi:pimeloyl-ACP methyl ester carboxylesterase